MIFDLIKDFSDALAALPEEHPKQRNLRRLEEAIRRDIHFIDRHPTTMFQCMWNTCWWYDCTDLPKHYAASSSRWERLLRCFDWVRTRLRRSGDGRLSATMQRWHDERQKSAGSPNWIRSLRPPPTHLDSAERVVLRAGGNVIVRAVWSPDDRQLACVSADGTLHVWDADNFAACLPGHHESVSCICYSSDARTLASGSGTRSDSAIRIWDTEGWRETRVLRGHRDAVQKVCFSPSGCILAGSSSDETIRIWDVSTGQALATLNAKGAVRHLIWSPDGFELAAVILDDDRVKYQEAPSVATLHVWDVRSGEPVLTARQTVRDVLAISYIGSDLRVLRRSGHSSASLSDPQTGNELVCFDQHEDKVHAGFFSADGQFLVTLVHSGGWRNVSPTPGIVTNTFPCAVRVWETQSGLEVARFQSDASVPCVAFSADNCRIAVAEAKSFANFSGCVKVLDLRRHEHRPALENHGLAADQIQFSHCGRHIASRGDWLEGKVILWNASNGDPVCRIGGADREQARVLCFSPDSHQLAIGAGWSGRTVRVWDTRRRRELRQLTGHSDDILSLAFSANGELLVSGADRGDRKIRVWHIRTGREVATLSGYNGKVTAVCFSTDGRLVAATIAGMLSDRAVMIWDTKTGERLKCMSADDDELLCISFSPCGQCVAAGGNRVRIYNVETGVPIRSLPSYSGPVIDLHYSRDGSRIVTASSGKLSGKTYTEAAVRVIDAGTGECLETLYGVADASLIAARPASVEAHVALVRGGETAIELSGGGETAGWYPWELSRVAGSHNAPRWAGSNAKHVHIFQLEQSHTPTDW